MFWRLLFQMLRGSRGRLAVALVALVSGAAVISALINLDLDIGSKLTQEFRTLGANIVVSPPGSAHSSNDGAGTPVLMDEAATIAAVEKVRTPIVVAAAPFLYIVGRVGNTPVVVVGTKLDELSKLEPSWKLKGQWVDYRDNFWASCVVGRNVAKQLHLSIGSRLDLKYQNRMPALDVTGILDTGGTEDNQMFIDISSAQQLSGLQGRAALAQLSVIGTPKAIANFSGKLAAALPGYDVRPIRQVSEAEGSLLARIRLLIFSMVLLILVLTALCVLATMAALAIERREDVGLMKALGGSISRVVGLFLAEVGVLGAAGGIIGCIAGVVLSQWMGHRVFGATISVRWEIFPLTIGLMIVVALAGASPLRLLGNVKPAAIFRGE
ncbi:MAG: ABC transporter permease [Candidatus Acidiferrales bacterium]